MALTAQSEPSSYMQTLTRYLSNIMNTTLLGLPREIRELIYFDALSHTADKILVSPGGRSSPCACSLTRPQSLPLSQEVKHINPNAVAAMTMDVQYLTEFVGSLENASMLQQNLERLQQTVALMGAESADEFYDVSIRNKKYGQVNVLNGPVLLEK